MLQNNDAISKPKKSRHFGFTSPDLIQLINELNFQHSEYQKRLNVALVNPKGKAKFGTILASFCPGQYLTIFSVPDDITPKRAYSLCKTAIHEFAIIDNNSKPQWSKQKRKSFRAYLSNFNNIVITERNCSLKLAKYRSTAKFSNAFNPKGVYVDEKIIRTTDTHTHKNTPLDLI